METIKFLRSREKFLFLLWIFLSRARLSSMPDFSIYQNTQLSNFNQPGSSSHKA